MIVLIQDDNGKAKSKDYMEYTSAVYDLPVNKANDVKLLYYRFLEKLMKENKLIANHQNPKELLVTLQNEKIGVSKPKELHNKLLAENDLFTWIERNWNVKKLEFEPMYF